MKRNRKPISRVTVSLLLLLSLGLAATAVAEQKRYEFALGEIVWFDVTGNTLVSYLGSGSVQVWDLSSGAKVSERQLVPYDRHRVQLMLDSDTGKLVLCRSTDPNTSVCVYEVPGMRLQSECEIPGFGLTPRAITPGGDQVMLSRPDRLVRIDAKTGQILWQRELRDEAQVGLRTWGGTSMRHVLFGKELTCITESESLWKLPVPESLVFNPASAQPTDNAVIIWVEPENRYVALDLKDGSALWERREMPMRSLRAISHDSSRQAFVVGGMLRVFELPSRKHNVAWVETGDAEVRFLGNGSELVYLPALQAMTISSDPDVLQLARASRTAVVYDCIKRRVIRRVLLERPQ